MKKIQILSGFSLRMIAILSMIVDHIALALGFFGYIEMSSSIYMIMRIIGRIAFPLFALGIVEGVIHSTNKGKYFLRLFVMLLIMMVGYILVLDVMGIRADFTGNIYSDLLLGALAIYFISLKNTKSFLVLIPLSITAILQLDVIPTFLATQYSFYGVLLIVLMYLGYLFIEDLFTKFCAKNSVKIEDVKQTLYFQKYVNAAYSVAIVIIFICLYVLYTCFSDLNRILPYNFIQDYCILSVIFIMLYNGKRGYNAKWYRIASYLIYPVHLILIFGIFYLINL